MLPVLVHPSPNMHTVLTTNTSSTAVRAVLQQKVNGELSIAFFSRKLYGTELNYSAFDHELLAVYLGVTHFQFRYFLEG